MIERIKNIIGILEHKGILEVLVILYENDYSIRSKYKLEKLTNLSKVTLNKRINLLRELNLLSTKKQDESLYRIKVVLTDEGIQICEILINLLKSLNQII
jgi:DNA-binding HxlR family transcriptional regulator